MSIPAVKVASVLGATGGVTGLGYLSFQYISSHSKKVSISELFKKEGRTLLTKGSDVEQWKERWNAYVKDDKNSWKLESYVTEKADVSKAPNSFIDKCLTNAEVKVSDASDPLYLEVVKNCSKEFKIDDLVNGNSQITNLNISTGEETEWKGAWKNYLDDNGDNNPWELTDWSAVKSQVNQFSADLKVKCGVKKGEKVFGSKDPKFASFIRWCSKVSG